MTENLKLLSKGMNRTRCVGASRWLALGEAMPRPYTSMEICAIFMKASGFQIS